MKVGYAEGELEGDWAVFAKIAGYFVNKVPPDDREDFLQDLLVEMSRVKAKYDARGKTLREAGLMLVASFELKDFWTKRRRRLFGLNCSHCTIEQRSECRTTRLPSECPKGKAYQVLSLNRNYSTCSWIDGDKPTELWETIPDDKVCDIAAKLDARQTLKSLPKEVVRIGHKKCSGYTLTREENASLKVFAHLNLSPALKTKVFAILKSHPEGVTRRDISNRLNLSRREVNRHLAPMIKQERVVEIKRENTRGRPLSPLLVAVEYTLTLPKPIMVKAEQADRIRQAHFVEGWSIYRIKKELHHDKRTIRRALNAGPAVVPTAPAPALAPAAVAGTI